MMYFHEDSIEETYDIYHQNMSRLLKIDNRPFQYEYIHINDRELALKNSKENHFVNSLFLYCHKHMQDNLIRNILSHITKTEETAIVDHIMGDMAGAESIPEFHRLNGQIKDLFPTAFKEGYVSNFTKDILQYMVEPRLKAKRVIPKFLKTNPIEALNATVKREIEHTPRPLPELVTMMKRIVQDIKENMIQALYNEGPWRIAPGSRLKPISKACWERWAKIPGKQERYFLNTVCAHKTHLVGQKNVLIKPQLPDQTHLSKDERKESKLLHKESIDLFNKAKDAEMLEKSKETGLPQLNANSQVKMKLSQKNRPQCNRTRVMYNHYPKQS